MQGRPRRLAALVMIGALVVSGCGRESGSRKAFCAQVAKVPPLSGVLAGYDQAEASELTRRLATTRRAYDDLRKAAPSAISDDADAMVDLVDVVLDAVGAHPTDPAAVQDTIRSAMAGHTDAGPGAANVGAYASERCGVALDPTLTPGTTPP